MKSNIEALLPETFYHIYNRGINGEDIFKQESNYSFFLKQYAKYIHPVAETYAYCLLKNHFHILIRTLSEQEIKNNLISTVHNADRVRNPVSVMNKPADKLISLQFSHLCNSYAQAINKQNERTGGLFETPFRRKEITTDSYLTQIIYYIHSNPQKHGFCADFREYEYSSYQSLLSRKTSKLKRNEVIDWFGDEMNFKKSHSLFHEELVLQDLILEE